MPHIDPEALLRAPQGTHWPVFIPAHGAGSGVCPDLHTSLGVDGGGQGCCRWRAGMVQKGRGVARCRRRRAGLLSAGLGKRGSAGESVGANTVATCLADLSHAKK